MTWRTLLACLAVMMVMSLAARAQPDTQEVTIAFYAPSVYFENSVARAGFIDSLASRIEAEIGLRVRGINVSSAGDLDDADFAIVDGLYYATSRQGDPLASAEAAFGTSGPLSLLVSSSGPRRLSELRGARLILPRLEPALEQFITHRILHDELEVPEFFAEIDHTSNIESALSAVAQGRADATVGFAAYADISGLRILDRFDDAPMPIAVQIHEDLEDTLANDIQSALWAYTGDGAIRGFARTDEEAIGRFRRYTTTSATTPTPIMSRPRTVTIDIGGIELPDVAEDLPVGSSVNLFDPPPMEEP